MTLYGSVERGQFDVSVHRLFNGGSADNANALRGLDFSRFNEFNAAQRGSNGPFRGAGAAMLNRAEAFYQDAIRAIKQQAFVIPSPFGTGDLATRDVLLSPCHPWESVPFFGFRFPEPETFYFLKRGLSLCMDVGLFFPDRRLLVSFQQDEHRIAQDRRDLQNAFEFLSTHREQLSNNGSVFPGTEMTAVIINSNHFAHHIWNELSVVEGIVAEGLHREVLFIVNRRPLAPLAELFPEIPNRLIMDLDGPFEEPLLYAMKRSLFVAPTGRRFIPQRLIDRILSCARARFAGTAMQAGAFRAEHEFVLWATIRLDARTATNLVHALAASISALLRQYPRMGVVFDGATLPSSNAVGWYEDLIDREARAAGEIASLVEIPFDYVVLSGKYNMEAFLWAEIADYYVCPYGTAQHKIAWVNPVPGLVHVGANKRDVASVDSAYHAVQRGATPRFFFGTVTGPDSIAGTDGRKDLFSYQLDSDAFAAFVENAVRERSRA